MTTIALAVSLSIAGVIITGGAVFCFYALVERRKRLKKDSIAVIEMEKESSSKSMLEAPVTEHHSLNDLKSSIRIPELFGITISEKIGSGHFGDVWMGDCIPFFLSFLFS
jgi:hypothetical protein